MLALRFNNLTLGYDHQPAIHQLDTEIAAGSLTAVVGPNGAGKSTLLKGVIGALVPMEGSLTIHDGLHRRVALEMALQTNPQLKYETIPVILYIDTGLEQCQQVFIDLNRWGVKLPLSLTILYDNRDAIALMVKRVVKEVTFFNDYTYLEGDRIPKTSDKLLTLYQLYQATVELLGDVSLEDDTEKFSLVLSYWQEVSYYLEDNKNDEKFDQLLLRLGKMGGLLLVNYPDTWKERLQGLNLSENL